MEKTVAAIATARGEAGIGIVRMSGPEAGTILERVFVPAGRPAGPMASHRLCLGTIQDGENTWDQVLAVVMRAPRSYTGEDMAEIHCHGGYLVQHKILECLLQAGASPAEPGEFTRRAFLNGRLDLVQAEAILDIIGASSERGLALANRQLAGDLSGRIRVLLEGLLKLLAFLEASLDFPEDEVGEPDPGDLGTVAAGVQEDLCRMSESYQGGRWAREGIRVAIVGRPNVGKSSLLNALVGEARAIVTDIPGTTRDTVDQVLVQDGLRLQIIDTAGIRRAGGAAEKMGQERTVRTIGEADLVLLVAEAPAGITREDTEILRRIQAAGRRLFTVYNKADLLETVPESADPDTLYVSAREDLGIDTLRDRLRAVAGAVPEGGESGGVLTRLRHYELILRAREDLAAFQEGLQEGRPEDFLCIDLRAACDRLSEILGENVSEELFERIFQEFCIGK